MRTLWLFALVTGAALAQQSDQTEDRRIERPKGYHIISRPARVGETPPEVKQEKADEDSRRRRNNTDIFDQNSIPTREPELKPTTIKP